MKIRFGSVIYKEAEIYFDDFANSLLKQSAKNFDIFLLSDNYSTDILQNIRRKLGKYRNITVSPALQRISPARLRVELLRRAKQDKIDLLVLGDCDDYFSKDRIELMVQAYLKDSDATFYYNQILDFNGNPVLNQMPDLITDYRTIGEYNFLGLSNAGINLHKINQSEIDSLDEYEGKVFDWYLFSRILLWGGYGIKVDKAVTFYRLHQNNVAGRPMCSEEKIKSEIEIKRNHYYSLKKYDSYFEEKYEQYCRCDNLVIHDHDCHKFWWDLTSCQS